MTCEKTLPSETQVPHPLPRPCWLSLRLTPGGARVAATLPGASCRWRCAAGMNGMATYCVCKGSGESLMSHWPELHPVPLQTNDWQRCLSDCGRMSWEGDSFWAPVAANAAKKWDRDGGWAAGAAHLCTQSPPILWIFSPRALEFTDPCWAPRLGPGTVS